jgi:shikimate 5-dehydrogenase
MGEPFVLVPISVPDADELAELFTVRGETVFAASGIEPAGWAVTSPYKRQAAAAADRHAPRVLRAGAANTLLLGHDFVTAENTDADGIVGSLTSAGFDVRGRTAVVQGTGGAARGAAVGLHLAGADVVLRGRSEEVTKSVAEAIGTASCPPGHLPDETSVLVNATPLGAGTDEPLPFDDHELGHAEVVVDMVYRERGLTALHERVHDLGKLFIDGREVLVHQGIAQIAAFTQRVPPKDAVRAALALEPRAMTSHRDRGETSGEVGGAT